jgi:hypothetical protein
MALDGLCGKIAWRVQGTHNGLPTEGDLMASLSISRAWDETRARIAADGRLMAIVAAALIVLPGLIVEVVSPGTSRTQSSMTYGILLLVSSLLALVGQLSIIHLAVTPSVSVGEAIGHGARRMPIYLLAGILLTLAFFVALVPFGLILYAAGVPLDRGSEQALVQSPVALLLTCLYFLLVFFVAIRMILSSPVASEEAAGPVHILRRSWELTSGHWWRLFAFIMLFIIAALVVMTAVNIGVSSVAVVLFGPIDSMSLSALFIGLFDSVASAAVTVFLAVMLARIYIQLAGRDGVSVPRSGI